MPEIDDKICPLCLEPNQCQAGDPACWCNFESVPQELRALVPAHLAMKACICRKCILAWKTNPAAFAANIPKGKTE